MDTPSRPRDARWEQAVKEAQMVDKLQDALARLGIEDEVVAGALFFPRGHFGGAFAGGMIGGDLGDRVGGLAGGMGMAGGVIAGQRAADAAWGLPERMLVGVSATTVYGFNTHREHEREPTDLTFKLPRSQLDVRVHQRVNVRVVELIDKATGAKVELEGARLPGFHVGDFLDAIRS
jgi:hypothetical protein